MVLLLGAGPTSHSMFKILDRYVVREVLIPFFLSLLISTFLLEMPPILDQGEKLIEKGVGWGTIVHVLALLLPQALGVTIPISLLLGLLIGLGRLSADREFVALQACGISIFRVLRPVAGLAIVACVATGYVMIEALPNANQTFREIAFNVTASRAQSDVKPRVFFEADPKHVLYVQDTLPGGGWRDVFVADSTRPDETSVYLAEGGRMIVDREQRVVELLLETGTRHTTFLKEPEKYEGSSFDRLVLRMDAELVLPRARTLLKGDNEMTIAELRAEIAKAPNRGPAEYGQLFTIQQKFAIPGACLVLALIGLGLGLTNRKDGKLAGFVLGFGVIMIYYFLLWTSRALAVGGRVSPTFAPWVANLVLGGAGIALIMWRAGAADQQLRITIPAFGRRASPDGSPAASRPRRNKVTVVIRLPRLNLPRPSLLDLYVTRQYLRIFGLGLVGLLGLFYISTFMDFADKLFRGTATTGMLVRYFYFATPQFIYYIIPMAALIATLVVIGLLTKNSELIVMRACGVSLYRSAAPLLVFAAVFSGVLFLLQEQVLAESNRKAEAIRHVIRGFAAQTFGVLDRRWIVGRDEDIYHYEYFDPRANRFSRLTVFDLASDWRLGSLTYATDVGLVPLSTSGGRRVPTWQGRQGWTRGFSTTRSKGGSSVIVDYAPFAAKPLSLEEPGYFKTDVPDADRMTYRQLERYIAQLQASGFYVVPYMVRLQRKVAFPFVTLVMTLLAVPFAVTIGRSGALYGIGIALVLAISYWTMLSVFGAVGAGGLISPMLAAWAPNLLFGAAAAYMILTVRT
jgi:LPS export ABC transporter permease LptG/LPS export ABC transporter permease LptF